VVYSLVAYVVVSYPMGLTLGLFNPGPAVMALFATGLAFVIGAGVGLFVLYSNVLDEDIADFRVRLLLREVGAIAPADVVPEAAVR
jgi:hypothetical protein